MNLQDWERRIHVPQPLIVEGVGIRTQNELTAFYEQQLARFGPCGRAMAYPEEELYLAKLEQYRGLLGHLIQPNETVLDVGCGFGSLLNIIGECKYEGIDLVPGFVDEARRRHPGHHFHLGNVMALAKAYDWVIGLGITGTGPEPAHLVAKMWELAGQGMVIDFIDATRYREDLNNFDIGQCLAMFHELGASLVLIHSWGAYIWAIFEAHR
jgi:SAM-dependent methyltransferase